MCVQNTSTIKDQSLSNLSIIMFRPLHASGNLVSNLGFPQENTWFCHYAIMHVDSKPQGTNHSSHPTTVRGRMHYTSAKFHLFQSSIRETGLPCMALWT